MEFYEMRKDLVMPGDMIRLAPAWTIAVFMQINDMAQGVVAVAVGFTMADFLTLITIIYTIVLLVLKVWEAYQKCMARRRLNLRRRASDLTGTVPRPDEPVSPS
jgi:hypothetical protein